MGLKIRLARAGAKKRPYYHIVIADSRSPRDGRFIEKVGSYNPMLPSDHAERIRLQEDRLKHWLGHGAVATDRGFASAANSRALAESDTFDALCPRPPAELSRKMKGKKFARLQRRRAQAEARIGILKHGLH